MFLTSYKLEYNAMQVALEGGIKHLPNDPINM